MIHRVECEVILMSLIMVQCGVNDTVQVFLGDVFNRYKVEEEDTMAKRVSGRTSRQCREQPCTE